jgi:hypothetical protein
MTCYSTALAAIPKAALPVSVQLAMRTADHPSTHILDYLAKCEHAAVICHRNDLIRHYQECWYLVHQANFGNLPLPIMAHFPKPECPPILPGPLKPWEKQKYSRPMRKVVSQREERRVDEHGHVNGVTTVLVLECGHETESLFGETEVVKAKRRRCRVCVDVDAVAKLALQRAGGHRA